MNIGDIAEMAKVSRAAVSRYLNDGYISEEKRERIRKVIEETGYQPSATAQMLRTRRTRLVGVILPRINSDSISGTVEGIGAVLHEAGYDMLLASTDNDPAKELDFLRIFANRRVDGIILIATVFTGEHRKIIKDMSIPLVIVGQQLPGCSCVFHDDRGAGAALTRHLLERGRRSIGFLGVLKEDVAVGQRRREGYADALREAGISVLPSMCGTADFSIESGYEKMGELLLRCPEMDAVVCATDQIALGAIRRIRGEGRRVPEDIAVAGFGDNKLAAVTTPAITTIHFYYRKSGESAARVILGLLRERGQRPKEIRLGFEFVARESA